MAQAWQVREFKQQRFIEELLRMVYDAAEDCEFSENTFLVKFCRNILNQVPYINPAWHGDSDTMNLVTEVEKKIRAFARIESEVKYLYYLLFQKLLPSIFASVISDYQHDVFTKELQVYGMLRTAEVKGPF